MTETSSPAEFRLNEIETKDSQSPTKYNPQSIVSPFLLFIDWPKDHLSDCNHIVELINMKKNIINVITNKTLLTTEYEPINNTVSSLGILA